MSKYKVGEKANYRYLDNHTSNIDGQFLTITQKIDKVLKTRDGKFMYILHNNDLSIFCEEELRTEKEIQGDLINFIKEDLDFDKEEKRLMIKRFKEKWNETN